jgi:hypothetical protein
VYWLAVGLAGGTFAVSLAVLVLVWLGLQSTHRTERVGDERLEMLREQRASRVHARRAAHAGGGAGVAALDDVAGRTPVGAGGFLGVQWALRTRAAVVAPKPERRLRGLGRPDIWEWSANA